MAKDRKKRFLAGFGRQVITPPYGFPRSGGYRVSYNFGILEELFCRAFVVGDGETACGFVSFDMLNTTQDLQKRVRYHLRRLKVPFAGNVAIAATHTHTGPHIGGIFGQPCPDAEYLDRLGENAALAVETAWKSMRPSSLRTGAVQKNPYAYNRRHLRSDGSAATNPGPDETDLVRREGLVDREIGILEVEQDGNRTGLVLNIVNHPATAGTRMISADWPGQLERGVQEKLGMELPVITLVGTSGNINHIGGGLPKKKAPHRHIGRGYARIVCKALEEGGLEPVRFGPVRMAAKTIRLKYRKISPERIAEAKKILKLPEKEKERRGKLRHEMRPFFAEQLLDYLEWAKQNKRKPYELMALQVGRDFAAVFLPGEPFVQVGMAIKGASPFRRTFVSWNSNGYCGYVPMPECFERGGYEVQPVRDGGTPEDTADRFVDESLALLGAKAAARARAIPKGESRAV